MLIIQLFFSNKNIDVQALNKFARANKSINLYKSINNESINNIICLVEKSYFVEILYENQDYFNVNYNGINGYVKQSEVQIVSNIPYNPYPQNISLVIQNTCNLRKSPTIQSNTNNVICTVNSGESDFIFIGRIFAEEAIDFGGTTWYYVNYKGNYGYIYNKYVKSITPIIENTEKCVINNENGDKIINPITHTPTLFIIVILFIPCLFILIVLYLPRKINKKIKIKKKQKEIERY